MSRATLQPQISTPIPQGAQIQNTQAIIQINPNVRITLLRDERRRNLPADGETSISINFTPAAINRELRIRKRRVRDQANATGISPTYTIRIQSFYRNLNNRTSTSGYGRGTSENDRNAENTSLRFHEGSHGTHWINYIRTHPLPVFNIFDGMTPREVRNEFQRTNRAFRNYINVMNQENDIEIDCPGIPINSSDIQCPNTTPASEPTRQRVIPIE